MATVIDDLLVRLGFISDGSGADDFEGRLGRVAKTAARVAKIGAVAMAGMGAVIVNTAGNFEEAMNAVSAVSGAAGDDFDRLRELAKKMGAETAFSATDAANGMEYLAMAGLSVEQVMETIPNALSLAAAGSIDLAQSADILSNIMSGMGIEAGESGRVADVLAAAAAGANTNISALGAAMKYVAPIAKTMGYTLEETASAIGVLGNAGIAGEQAGTSLRAIYSRIASDAGAKKTMEAMGVATTDAAGKMRSMTELVEGLQTATQDLSAEDQIEIFKNIAGAEAMGALAVLVDGIANDSLPALTSKLNSADGAAESMAAKRLEGFKGTMKILLSTIESAMLNIADAGLLEAATDGLEYMVEIVGKLAVIVPPMVSAAIKSFKLLAKVIGTLIDVFLFLRPVMVIVALALALMYAPAIAGFIALKVTALMAFLAIKAAAIASAAATAAAWLIALGPFLLIAGAITVVVLLLWKLFGNFNFVFNAILGFAKFVFGVIIGFFKIVFNIFKFILDMIGTILKYSPIGLAYQVTKTILTKFKGDSEDDGNDSEDTRYTPAATSQPEYGEYGDDSQPSLSRGFFSTEDKELAGKLLAGDRYANTTGKSAYQQSPGAAASNYNESNVTQHINVNSANEAAIIAARTAQGARQNTYGYQ